MSGSRGCWTRKRACQSSSTHTSAASTHGTLYVLLFFPFHKPATRAETNHAGFLSLQADIYSHGRSERIIRKALEKYSIPRSKVVILSKCYFGVIEDSVSTGIAGVSINDGEMVNQLGLSRKHIFDAVQKSVERLGTYIDVLQIHRLDRDTPREEIMKALNDVVEKGWVRYIGASSVSTPSCSAVSKDNKRQRMWN